MIVGGYTVHLYCDSDIEQPYGTKGHSGPQEGGHGTFTGSLPDEYSAETRAQCIKQARAKGWLIGKDRQLCPTCRREMGL